MNLFHQILFPRLHRALVRLREAVGQTTNTNTMSLTTTEEVQIAEEAAALVLAQRTRIKALLDDLGNLPGENAELKARVAQFIEEDAASDAAFERLKAVLPEPPPVTDPPADPPAEGGASA